MAHSNRPEAIRHFTEPQWPSEDSVQPSSKPALTTVESQAQPSRTFSSLVPTSRFSQAVAALILLCLVALVVTLPVVFLIVRKPSWQDRGPKDTVLSQVLSIADLDGQLFVSARGHDGQIWYTTRDQGEWNTSWTSTGQKSQSQPTSLVWGVPKRLSLFYIGDDNTVHTNSLRNGTWEYWESLGAQVSSPAVLCREAARETIHVWAREKTDAKLILHNYWEATKDRWHTHTPDWETGINIGTAKGARSIPAVVCRNSSVTNDVLFYDKDFGSALHKQWSVPANAWNPWNDLGGSYIGDPVVVSPSDDRLDFFGVASTTRALHHISWTENSSYSSPDDLGGGWNSVPSPVVTESSRLDVFALGNNNTVQHRSLLGSTWGSSWSDLNISSTNAPLATLLNTQPPQILLLVLGSGGDVLSSEWEVTDDGGLINVSPVKSIGGNVTNTWLDTGN